MVDATKNLAIVPDRDPDVPTPTVYRFDRRRSERHAIGGCVTAVRNDHGLYAYRRPICQLRLRDLSDGGAGAVSDVPFENDERVSVYFTPHGAEGGFELTGHVVRCTPLRGSRDEKDLPVTGYEVGLRFDPASAA